MHTRLKIIISIFVLLLGTSIVFSSCLAVAGQLNSANISAVEPLCSLFPADRVVKTENLEEVHRNGCCVLYFDRKTGSVAYGDAAGGKLWTSLPEFSNSVAANLAVRVIYGEKQYILDSQSCRAEDVFFQYEKTEDGIKVSYDMRAENISVSIPVAYSLLGTCLEVKLRLAECAVSDGAVLVSFSLLPFMGAANYEYADISKHSDDYFLVPDGCGALIYTAKENKNISEFCFSVYGKDIYEKSIPASVAAYGIKASDSALAASVVEGDEISLIRAFGTAADECGIARIYPEFAITPVSGENGEIRYGSSYSNEISVLYNSLSGGEANYIGMAHSIRENFIRKGFLPTLKTQEKYSLNISLIGMADSGFSSVASDLEQAENLLKILKGKGINGINLILEGFLSGGMNQKNAASVSIPARLGGKKALSALYKYAETQEINVFLGVDILSSSNAVAALDINGEREKMSVFNPFYPNFGQKHYLLNKTKADNISQDAAKFLNNTKTELYSGYCVLDAADRLYADYSSEKGSFFDVSELIKKNLSAFSVHGKLMLSGCNFNAVGKAGYLKDLPLHTVIEESDAYKAVPFIPAMLHSLYIYSGRAVNIYDLPKLQLLKAVEYGAAPYYAWTFSQDSGGYYENYLADAVEFYLDAYKNLSDLPDRRITDHFLFKPGVYCTEYSGGVRIYVNYNNYSVVIGEISVMPYNYVRIG